MRDLPPPTLMIAGCVLGIAGSIAAAALAAGWLATVIERHLRDAGLTVADPPYVTYINQPNTRSNQ